MGKSDPANKVYEGKSRQDLELYYEKIETQLTIFSEPINESNLLEIKRLNEKLEQSEQNQRMFMQQAKEELRREIKEQFRYYKEEEIKHKKKK